MKICGPSQQAEKSAGAKTAHRFLFPIKNYFSLLVMIGILPARFIFPQEAQAQTLDTTTTGYVISGPGPWTINSGSVVSNTSDHAIQTPIGEVATLTVTITNNGSVVVTSTGNGMYLNGNAAITVNNVKGTSTNANDATISGAYSAIKVDGKAPATILNDGGTISSSNSYSAIQFNNTGDSTVNNKVGSIIKGSSYGVQSVNSKLTLTNDGTISASSNNAVDALLGFTGTNSGSITSDSGYGINYGGAGSTLSNSGNISGKLAGVQFQSGTSLTNSGTITGTGSIETAIIMGGTDQTLILDTGSNLVGNVINTTPNTNMLKLQGTGMQATGGMIDFQSLTMTGNSWTLGGTVLTLGTTAAATLVQNGALIITGTLTNGGVGGGSTIDTGASLQIGDGGTTGSVTGDITNNGTLYLNRSDENFDFESTITGSGIVRHIGSGKTRLVRTNDYSGTTFVDFGTLAAASRNSFSPNSNHNIADGATLDLSGYNQTIASLNHAGTIKLSTAVPTSPSDLAFSSPALTDDSFFALLMMDIPSLAPTGPVTVGTELTVTGDYVGAGGTIIFNTTLGDDNSPTDRLNIAGNSSGSALVKVNDVDGTGGATIEGIKLIDVAGNSGASFSLVSDYLFEGQPSVVAGAYSYRLYQNGVSTPTDGDWYLRSTIIDPEMPTNTGPVYQPGAPLYETYAQIMLGYNDGLITRLRDRVGDRYDNNTMVNRRAGIHKNTSNLWALMEGSHARIKPNKSTTGARYDYDKWRLQIGTDGRLYENAIGKLYGGIMGHFGTASADIKSLYGRGKVNLSAYGLGTSLTWVGQDDFYIDGQAHWSWYKSDIKSHSLGKTVAKNNHGHGYGMSLEVGRKIALNHGWEITPQAQLSYSEVHFNKFTDPYGASIALRYAQTLRGRLGAELGRSKTWKEHDGTMSRSHLYGLANLTYDFRNGSQVALSNAALKTHNDRLWAELGVGGSYRWNNDKYSLSGEASAKSSLNRFAKSYELRAKINFSISW